MPRVEQELVLESLPDSKKHSLFSASPAKISRKVGGKFSAYDNYIEGTNIKLIQDKLIVQSWRGSEWPEGHFSHATFALTKTKSGAKLMFIQTDIPSEFYESIKEGWTQYYWKPMKEMIGK